MVLKKSFEKWENCIWTGLLLLILLLVAGVCFDYCFDLNDDVLMKDILAGVYTGTPAGHNIQMLWPVSGFVSLLYRIFPKLPCYGLFLCICQYGSIGLVVCRGLSFCKKRTAKFFLLGIAGFLSLGLLLPQLISVQYTVTCTMLAAAAAFLFVTTDAALPAGTFVKKNIGTVLLVVLAFLIRSEMLLLVTPLICMAGVMKWGSEEKPFSKENFVKYPAVIGGILAGLLVSQLCHNAAYGRSDWKQFTEFFNNRTELYDFQVLPEYEPHKKFYDSIGISESERMLLENYNFGLSEEIDEKIVGQIAEYAAAVRGAEKPFVERLKTAMGNYYRRTVYGQGHNESDFPWNRVIVVSYLLVFAAALFERDKKLGAKLWGVFWKLALLGGMRSVLWLWLIIRERVPVRISVSMYVMEFCILLGFLLLYVSSAGEGNTAEAGNAACEGNAAGNGTAAEAGKTMAENRGRKKGLLPAVFGGVYLAAGLMILLPAFETTSADQSEKEKYRAGYEELYSYLSSEENKGNFYFIDVYSSVTYTEKLFENVDNSLDNYDIMGGWACKSPLWKSKLRNFGIRDMQSALLSGDGIYYVQRTGKDTGWLVEYYAGQGKEITLEAVAEPVEEFEIYRMREK
ncbi:MAG: hypothetical protein IKY23_01215 [Lachnospiraceae bacterium]|nr:hypothetical protein [Lachnospiraceae bacterium]